MPYKHTHTHTHTGKINSFGITNNMRVQESRESKESASDEGVKV